MVSRLYVISPDQQANAQSSQRRSRDGFVSATGMFKIAFPWAKIEEERSEREHLKSLSGTSEDEIAGNVWISPTFGKRWLILTSTCYTGDVLTLPT